MEPNLSEPHEINARTLLREVGNAFQRRGWQDTSDLALAITQQAQSLRTLDAGQAATLADQTFLTENNVSVALVHAALDAVFDGRSLLDPARDEPILSANAHDTRISIGDGNTGININVGGQLVSMSVATPRNELLEAIETFVVEALEGTLDEARLLKLDQLASTREDIDQPVLEDVVSRAVEKANVSPSKLSDLRNKVLTGAASGLFVQAILAIVHAI